MSDRRIRGTSVSTWKKKKRKKREKKWYPMVPLISNSNMPVRVDKFLIFKVFDLRVWHSSPRISFWLGNKCKVRLHKNFYKLKQPQWDIQKINERSERTYEDKGMLNFFSKKYTKTPSDRIEKKGPLLLTIYFPDYGNFDKLCRYKENTLQCFNPRYFSKPSFSRGREKSLSMGVFVDGS